MRRRNYLMRQRAELLAHITNTNHQYNLSALGVRPARPAERSRLAEHFAEAPVRKSVEVDLSIIEHYDRQLLPLERYLESNAQAHDPVALAIVRTIHGMGKVLGLSILYEVHDVGRFSRVQQFLSYGRLVKPTKESGDKILGHSGAGATRAPDGQAWQGQEPRHHRGETRPCRVLHAQAKRGVRRRALLRPLSPIRCPRRAPATSNWSPQGPRPAI